MDQELMWLIFVAVAITATLRWLMAGNAQPLSHQAVRQLLLYHLRVTCRDVTVRAEEEQRMVVHCGDKRCTIYLDQLYRQCAAYPPHVNALVRMAVQGINQALEGGPVLSDDWRDRIVPLLLRTDAPLPPNLVVRPLDGLLAIGYALNGVEAFRWITREDMTAAGVDDAQLHDIAVRNLERSCNMLEIETLGVWPDGHERLLRFTTNDGLDAARLLVPTFFQRFSPRFGDTDLVVAIPTRDTLVMVSTRDESHAELLAWRARRERQRQAYPLHDALIKVTENGLERWKPEATA